MGKRKTKKIKPSKSSLALKNRNKPLREFHCHYCQNDKSVWIRISKSTATANLKCRICGIESSFPVTSLDEPIDVYSIWVDSSRQSLSTSQGNLRDRPRKVAQPEDALDEEDKTIERDLDANYGVENEEEELEENYGQLNYTLGDSVSTNTQINNSYGDTINPQNPTSLLNSDRNTVNKRREVYYMDTQYYKASDPEPINLTGSEFVNLNEPESINLTPLETVNVVNKNGSGNFSTIEYENEDVNYQFVDIARSRPRRVIQVDESYSYDATSNMDNALGYGGVYGENEYREDKNENHRNFEKADSSMHNLFSDDQ
uniref:Transcription elongation factor Elf1 like, putative n=1 Tax=Theileria annulata TaxID=5874 RepID=A0A3B0N778_THEAN